MFKFRGKITAINLPIIKYNVTKYFFRQLNSVNNHINKVNQIKY